MTDRESYNQTYNKRPRYSVGVKYPASSPIDMENHITYYIGLVEDEALPEDTEVINIEGVNYRLLLAVQGIRNAVRRTADLEKHLGKPLKIIDSSKLDI